MSEFPTSHSPQEQFRAERATLHQIAQQHPEITIADPGSYLPEHRQAAALDEKEMFRFDTIRAFVGAPTIIIDPEEPHSVRRVTVQHLQETDPQLAPYLDSNRLRFNQIFGLYLLLNNPHYATNAIAQELLDTMSHLLEAGYDSYSIDEKVQFTHDIAAKLMDLYAREFTEPQGDHTSSAIAPARVAA
jgi:hypothetical protein